MQAHKDPRDTFRLIFFFFIVLFLAFIFLGTATLRPITFLTVLTVILISPVIRFLEGRRFSRNQAILSVFVVGTFFFVFGILNGVHMIKKQWSTLILNFPILWQQVVTKISELQASFEARLSMNLDLGIAEWLVKFGSETQSWILTHLPELLGNAASAIFLVPIFTFFFLKDGERGQQMLLSLIPKRYAKPTTEVLKETSAALGDFIRAKMIEASAVGIMSLVGFWLIGAPYAGIFAFLVGVTNVIPYLGIVLGAAAPLLIFSLTDGLNAFFWPTLIVLVIVNLIDSVLIFPVFVAKLVNLTPITLVVAVAVGQEYYGLVGMLISVPLASILKILYQEVMEILYDHQHSKKNRTAE